MKVLIWIEKMLERSGGPPTYVYNLKKSVELLSLEDKIIFYPDLVPEKRVQEVSRIKYKHLLNFIPKILTSNLAIFRYLISLNKFMKLEPNIDYSEFDIIHFHSTVDLFRNLNNLKSYNGEVLLTPHSPKAFHLEIIEDIQKVKRKYILPYLFKRIENIDITAFSRADRIVLPCEEAKEPYINTWPYFRAFQASKRFSYLPSATNRPAVKVSRAEIFKRHNIPKNAFVIIFAGRHNEVKGYDLFKSFGELILGIYSDIYILVLGQEDPIKGLKHPKWIEVGWTNDPHSYINAADLFILPNKETYFDLVLLEVLALAKIVMLSNTGGNKYFSKYKNAGLFFFEYGNLDKMLSNLNEIRSRIDIEKLKSENVRLFEVNFSNEIFAERYLNMISNKLK